MRSSTPIPLNPISFKLENYLRYINLTESEITPPLTSLETLKKIITHHHTAFPYHNTILFNASRVPISERKIPALDPDNLFNDMIKNQGGYCFQQLELLYVVLSEIGFKIDRYLAKVILQHYSTMNIDNTNTIKTHELLVIHLDSKKYIIDSGMAHMCLREPLELTETVQIIDDDQYQLIKDENNRWSLNTKNSVKNEWFCIYQFFNSSVTYEDIVKYHNDLYLTHENRPIRDNKYFTGITTSEKRKYILWLVTSQNGIFSSTKKNSSEEKKRELYSLDEAKELSRKKFGINI